MKRSPRFCRGEPIARVDKAGPLRKNLPAQPLSEHLQNALATSRSANSSAARTFVTFQKSAYHPSESNSGLRQFASVPLEDGNKQFQSECRPVPHLLVQAFSRARLRSVRN